MRSNERTNQPTNELTNKHDRGNGGGNYNTARVSVVQRVYQFFKTAVEKSPNVEIQPVILENISSRIPDHLKNGGNQRAVLDELLAEVQEEYKTVIRAYTGSLVYLYKGLPLYL